MVLELSVVIHSRHEGEQFILQVGVAPDLFEELYITEHFQDVVQVHHVLGLEIRLHQVCQNPFDLVELSLNFLKARREDLGTT